ncbi:MAG TPA: EAL domain-containing protein [Gemmatimonadota bacterium]|nr:EAL domain-containing protein [Gemmatimonadota bacterium]
MDSDSAEREYVRLLRATPLPVAIHRDGQWRFLNDAALELLGVGCEEDLLDQPVLDVVTVDDHDEALERRRRVEERSLAAGRREFRVVRPDGKILHVESRSIPVTFEGEPSSLTTVQDVTEARDAQRALGQSEARARAVAETASDAIITIDADSRIVYANPATQQVFGYEADELAGEPLTLLIPERLHAQHLESTVLTGTHRSGAAIQIEVSFSAYEIDEERFFTGIIRDVTEREHSRRRLEETEQRYRQLFEDSLDAVYVTDADGAIVEMNPAGLELFGYAPEDIGGIRAHEFYADPADRLRFQRAIARRGNVAGYEERLRRKNGELFDALITATADRGPDGRVRGYKGIIRDITERKEFEDQLERRALHDPLTELPNRALFWDRLENAIGRAARHGEALAVLFMDLDRFKVINDGFGHIAGDRLLAAVASRLQAAVRYPDTVARFGGDEFIVLIESLTDPEELRRIADRIVEVFKVPFTLSGQQVHVSTSVGMTLSWAGRVGDEVGREWGEELVRRADRAMYRAKTKPGTGVVLYDPELDEERRDAMHRETELRQAIDSPQFVLHYQPIVRLDEGRIVAVEALARWEHPERGMLDPGHFLALAEETGLIVPLGELLLETACLQVAAWNRGVASERPLFLHLNVSPRQFEAPGFVSMLVDILDRTGLERRLVELEITEHLVFHYRERTTELQELGVGISVDDFGTGYSSLSYVKHLAADVLKIDQDFVRGIDTDIRDRAIVKMILSLAETLELDVVAEGIETAAQLEHLRELGCGWGQGYFFAHPQAAEDCTRLLEADPRW